MFLATPISGTGKEANWTDDAAAARAATTEFDSANAHFAEQRQEEGFRVLATAGTATAALDTAIAADAAAVCCPSGDGDATFDAATSAR